MIESPSIRTAPDVGRDERSMKLFEYLVSALALLAVGVLALLR